MTDQETRERTIRNEEQILAMRDDTMEMKADIGVLKIGMNKLNVRIAYYAGGLAVIVVLAANGVLDLRALSGHGVAEAAEVGRETPAR